MIWAVTEEQHDNENIKRNAGGKAREDLNNIFSDCGFEKLIIECPQSERRNAGNINKLRYHLKVSKKWERALNCIKEGDSLIVQFPVINHSLFLVGPLRKVKKKKVKVIAFIHDLDALRMTNKKDYSLARRWRMKREELDELKLFDVIVAHNEKMKSLMINRLGLDEEKIVCLGIFDYLLPKKFNPREDIDNYNSCIIAGNLSKNKAAYIYCLPEAPEFELYGLNYEPTGRDSIHYHGSFLPEELPKNLAGGFGLVWDGDSADTCSGAWGEYLRYNNPHKTSLYLACGIPVIIWEEAALSEYILKNNVGITVKNLHELEMAIHKLPAEQYKNMRENAMRISEELRRGYNTERVLKEIGVLNS